VTRPPWCRWRQSVLGGVGKIVSPSGNGLGDTNLILWRCRWWGIRRSWGDRFGRIQPTYNTASNRYATLAGATPRYDANGNVQSDGFNTYTWDADGNITNTNNNQNVVLAYDAFDRLVEMSLPSYPNIPTGEYVYDPLGRYFFSASGFYGSAIQPVVTLPLVAGAYAEYGATGAIQSYLHPDWLGSSRLASSPSRTMLNDGSYSPFGNVTESGSGSSSMFFTGVNWPGLVDDAFPARTYAPIQGRWLRPDPAGMAAVDATDPQTWNRYAYVRNNPLALVDPSGMDTNYAGYQQGVCPASQANCPLNGPPVVGSPTFPGELGTAYKNYSALMNATFGGTPEIRSPPPTASTIWERSPHNCRN